MAVFTLDNGRTRTVHFGSAGASDYTQHRDPVRKQQYLARHAPREDWDNPMTVRLRDGYCGTKKHCIARFRTTYDGSTL